MKPEERSVFEGIRFQIKLAADHLRVLGSNLADAMVASVETAQAHQEVAEELREARRLSEERHEELKNMLLALTKKSATGFDRIGVLEGRLGEYLTEQSREGVNVRRLKTDYDKHMADHHKSDVREKAAGG